VLEDGRYPKTTLETLLQRSPEIIILPDEPYAFGDPHREEIALFFESHEASAQVLLMEGSYLTWFGTRTLPGLRYLYEQKLELLGGGR